MSDRFLARRRAVLASIVAGLPLSRSVAAGSSDAHGQQARSASARFETRAQAPVALTNFYTAGMSDTQMLNAAIDAANNRLPEDVPRGVSQGTVFALPEGRMTLDGPLTRITRNGGITFKGQGAGATELICTHKGTIFDFDPSDRAPQNYDVSGGIEDCSVTYPETPGSGAIFARFATTTNTALRNLRIRNVGTLCQLGDAARNLPAAGHILSNIAGTGANIPLPLVDCQRGSGLTAVETSLWVEGVEIPDQAPARVRDGKLATVRGRDGFRFGAGKWDTAVIAGTHLLFDRGVNVDAVGGAAVVNIWLSNAIFDYCGTNAVRVLSRRDANVGNIIIRDAYMVGWDGQAVHLEGNGHLFNIDISGVIAGAADHGIEAKGGGLRYLSVHDLRMFGVGRRKGNPNSSAILVYDGPEDINIHNVANQVEPFSYSWLPKFGLYIAPNIDKFVASSNHFEGEKLAYVFEANSSPSANRIAKNNIGANYAGIREDARFSLPASGTPWINTTPFEVWIAVSGGAVSRIEKNGRDIGLVSGYIPVSPGDRLALFYTRPPKLVFDVRA